MVSALERTAHVFFEVFNPLVDRVCRLDLTYFGPPHEAAEKAHASHASGESAAFAGEIGPDEMREAREAISTTLGAMTRVAQAMDNGISSARATAPVRVTQGLPGRGAPLP